MRGQNPFDHGLFQVDLILADISHHDYDLVGSFYEE